MEQTGNCRQLFPLLGDQHYQHDPQTVFFLQYFWHVVQSCPATGKLTLNLLRNYHRHWCNPEIDLFLSFVSFSIYAWDEYIDANDHNKFHSVLWKDSNITRYFVKLEVLSLF